MSGFTIDELSIPASLEGDGGADFAEMTRMRNDVEASIVGNYDIAVEPVELLPAYRDPYEPKRLFVARVDGRIVARGTHELQSGDDLPSAWLSVEVLPEFRRRGIGAALYDVLLDIAVADGRSLVQAFVTHGSTGGERIPSPTGFGSAPRDEDSTRFLLARGFRLAQVERMSRLPLPVALAAEPADPEYDLELWDGPTPTHRLTDLAELHARMSTDPPLGEMDYQPEIWDEDRVVANDARNAAEGRLWLTATARHIESDRLVAFTELTVPPQRERAVFQQDTLVLPEHRGHRLGMLVKAANLRRLGEASPGHPAVYTWNAEENRHMLDVNEAIGFVPVGYEGSWRKELGDA